MRGWADLMRSSAALEAVRIKQGRSSQREETQ